jgi:UDPglucose--hexose-1-phosphate uridylyltransferase
MPLALPGPHRRYNPLLDEWVLCSPQRLERPWQGQVETVASAALPAYDASCYLCPGNSRANGARNPPYTSTFIFDNDFPALLPEARGEAIDGGGLLVARPERGRCRVICFSPRHDLTLSDMDILDLRGVVDAWADEVTSARADPGLRYVQLFENKGAIMGCSNPHPHGQAWATATVPLLPARKLASQRAYFERHGRDLLGDYLERELREDERVVTRNPHWVWLVPFWAVWPFETMLIPRRPVPDIPSLSSEERMALAEILKDLNARYDRLFRSPFPYSMGWQGQPHDGNTHPEWRLHATWLPPLLRSASVKKFLVGYELAAEPQRDITAEAAAARLRELTESSS